MAIAYAQYILCGNQNGENLGANESCNLKFSGFFLMRNLGLTDMKSVKDTILGFE